MLEASIYIHIPHRARTLLMASITSSSHRWVRSIGHSQSYYLNPFLCLHSNSPSFLDITLVLCPLSVSSIPFQSHIDLHDTHPDLLSFSFQTPLTHTQHLILTHPIYFLLNHLSLYIKIHTKSHNRTLELP